MFTYYSSVTRAQTASTVLKDMTVDGLLYRLSCKTALVPSLKLVNLCFIEISQGTYLPILSLIRTWVFHGFNYFVLIICNCSRIVFHDFVKISRICDFEKPEHTKYPMKLQDILHVVTMRIFLNSCRFWNISLYPFMVRLGTFHSTLVLHCTWT